MKSRRKLGIQGAIWQQAASQSADPERVRHYFDLLSKTDGAPNLKALPKEHTQILSAMFSGSQALSTLVTTHPAWLELLNPEALAFARRKQGLRQERDHWLQPLLKAQDWTTALNRLREFKSREMLRIGARDLARLGELKVILDEISNVADVVLEAVWQICWLQLVQRHGRPYHLDAEGRWQPTSACVLGMGKLGGQELNYSSDVDVLFVYAEEGEVYQQAPSGKPGQTRAEARGNARDHSPQRSTLANHQFFNRLAKAFISEVTHLGPQGALYRIDLRLRPEGDSGPLSRSLSGYENYYAQWGQTWERMMLIKARVVAGDEAVGAEFLEMVQPFRYPRSIGESALQEVGGMKDRIENEVVRADALERNVKLGRGGIREIEFIAQALQLLHAGRHPFLQGSQTLPALQKLAEYEFLPSQGAQDLIQAYGFLRDVEHRLQMENDRQTHTIPFNPEAQRRLARLMGFAGTTQFEAARREHSSKVRGLFESVLQREVPKPAAQSQLPKQFEGAEAEWKKVLGQFGFKDVDRAVRTLREFVEGPGYVHVSPRTSELVLRLLSKFFELCPGGSRTEIQAPKPDPLRGSDSAARVSSKSETRIGASNDREPSSDLGVRPSFGLQTSAFGFAHKSRVLSDPDRVLTRLDSFISAYGARATLFELWNSNPALFELLLLLFDRSEFLAELAIRTPDLVDELVTSGRLRQRKSTEETLRDLRHGIEDEDQRLWLRRYHQTEVMRIGLRDILGLAHSEQYLTELSKLADACLRYALEVVLRKYRMKAAPFVIIGLGKLGGAEIDYGSDLDLLFVAGPKIRDLGKPKRIALEVMELLSTRTEQGLVFHTDARLRPDGEKGLLVNTLKAFEEYYRRRAMLWEIQTLTRTRPIAGDMTVGAQFQALASKITNFSKPSLPVSAFTPDWKRQIHRMRQRIESERTPRGQDDLAIKTGKGGVMDAEFIAQTLCMAHGWHEPNTLNALERGKSGGLLPGAEELIESYRQLRRVEGILRRWSYEGETVLPSDPEPYYRVAVRCGFPSADAFREALRVCRSTIREVYNRYFEAADAKAGSARP
jgi:glutamate-ammonia-ligase adenylyltransferase